jgi:hypothetical protein
VLVGRHRRQRELLRRHRLLQVEHQAHHARLVLADTHAGDVGVVGPHLADQLAQLRVELEAVDVDHQAAGFGRGSWCAGRQRRSDSIVTRV